VDLVAQEDNFGRQRAAVVMHRFSDIVDCGVASFWYGVSIESTIMVMNRFITVKLGAMMTSTNKA